MVIDSENYDSMMNKFFKSKSEVISEIINLQAILNLPKSSEHFMSDLHGEADTFIHILKNASGVIRLKTESLFENTMSYEEIQDFLTLIYYPEESLKVLKQKEKSIDEWYKKTLINLVKVLREISSKYTRSKVRKALPQDYAYIIDELINMSDETNKERYYSNIIASVIELGEANNFIIALCQVIQRLAVDHLHIVGDIFDRGRGADVIFDKLMNYHSLDIQWGNHDILWVGASLGNLACIANIIRINCSYKNLEALETAYGINLRSLETFALNTYKDDICENFKIRDIDGDNNPFDDNKKLEKMFKAITIIQIKLENRLVRNHPEWKMNDRLLLKDDKLTKQESDLVSMLKYEFTHSRRLKTHIEFLLEKGSMYKIYNGNLLFHGCVPTEKDGSFSNVCVKDEMFSGKQLFDRCDRLVRNAFVDYDKYSIDFLWYLWCGKDSPLFGRDAMKTYETYILGKKVKETQNPYYNYVKKEDFCDKVLEEFNVLGQYRHIINGHVPVKVISGESPVGANGKHIVIDGGLSKTYHKKTGIGGYTLMSNSHGLYLTTHEPFCKVQEAIKRKIDLQSSTSLIQKYRSRIMVKDTDIGKTLQDQIDVLKIYLKEHYGISIKE